MAVQNSSNRLIQTNRSSSPEIKIVASTQVDCCCGFSNKLTISIDLHTLKTLGCGTICGVNELDGDIDVKFSGDIKNGLPVGSGTIDFLDNYESVASFPIKCYFGEFNEGRLFDGQGRLEYLDGSVFEGEFSDGALVNGRMTYSNGDVYDGAFKNGSPDGIGILTKVVNSVNGKLKTVFNGNFNNNTLTYGKRDVFLETFWDVRKLSSYQGQFEPDKSASFKPSGIGTYIDTVYSGYKTTVDSNLIEGLSKNLCEKDQQLLSEVNGDFDGDILNGKAVVISADKKWFYLGEFKNSKLVGDIALFKFSSRENNYKCIKRIYTNFADNSLDISSQLLSITPDKSINESHKVDRVVKDMFFENVRIKSLNSDYLGSVIMNKGLDGVLESKYHGNGVLYNNQTKTKTSGEFLFGSFVSGDVAYANNILLSVSRSQSDRFLKINYGNVNLEFRLSYRNLKYLTLVVSQLEKLEIGDNDFLKVVENFFEQHKFLEKLS